MAQRHKTDLPDTCEMCGARVAVMKRRFRGEWLRVTSCLTCGQYYESELPAASRRPPYPDPPGEWLDA